MVETPSSDIHTKKTGARPVGAQAPWALGAVIVVGGLLSGLAAVALVGHQGGQVDPVEEAEMGKAPPIPVQTGHVSIGSNPSGALVVVNGEEIILADGDRARTPITMLTELKYGSRYDIELRLEDHTPYKVRFTMNEFSAGRHIHGRLETSR